MEAVKEHQKQEYLLVCIEDTRLRKWVKKDIRSERLKGVGSVNRL